MKVDEEILLLWLQFNFGEEEKRVEISLVTIVVKVFRVEVSFVYEGILKARLLKFFKFIIEQSDLKTILLSLFLE